MTPPGTRPAPGTADAALYWVDLLLRGAGAVLAVVLATLTAFLEAMGTAVRIDGWPAVWVLPLAVVVNVLLIWFARTAVGMPWAWWFVAAPWFLVMVFAVGGTSEGDQLANSWLGLGLLALGGMAIVGPVAFHSARRPFPRSAAQ
ncbi:hypothetical protein Cs7R123_75720 [Catellatospora sp. TT07R-123]|uniref:hypothetical protein n=1 Tax=Catellatospora sp. TT07R-123 TaxID=2733863 RepID=UPI001B0C0CE9|nr:hypothetical protein [Catellatospora sp. TT07R-123]GHJ50230.1 hypothetical protein Cs7R123_75720 [Catellatospora sp. TT07R-123]